MKKLFIQLDLCIGCQSHSVACQRVSHGAVTCQSAEVETAGSFPVVCRHCEEPACVAACPQEAMTKDEDGVVRRNASRCTGCRSCVLACPFGVLSSGMDLLLFPKGKCDLCTARVEAGRVPACVATCPTGALRYEEVDEAYSREREIMLGAHMPGFRTLIRRP